MENQFLAYQCLDCGTVKYYRGCGCGGRIKVIRVNSSEYCTRFGHLFQSFSDGYGNLFGCPRCEVTAPNKHITFVFPKESQCPEAKDGNPAESLPTRCAR